MSNYIQEARKNLALWAETIDVDTFTEQYESLDHCRGGVLLEDESLDRHYQFVTTHLKNYDTYDSVLVDLVSPETKSKTGSEMVVDYLASFVVSKISRYSIQKTNRNSLINSYSLAFYEDESIVKSRKVNNDEYKRNKQTRILEVA